MLLEELSPFQNGIGKEASRIMGVSWKPMLSNMCEKWCLMPKCVIPENWAGLGLLVLVLKIPPVVACLGQTPICLTIS